MRRALSGISWGVLLPAALLAAVGVTFVWSTTHTASAPLWGRQLAFLGAGAGAGLVVMRIGVRQLAEVSWVIYGFLLLLLAAMPWLAHGSPTGTERWIELPWGFKLQPSEFMKLGLLLVLARHLRHRGVTNTWGSYAMPFALTLLPWWFVMRQPDLGSSLVLLPILLAMVIVSGARARHVAALAGGSCAMLMLAYFIPGALHDYQKERIDNFVRPLPALMEEARELHNRREHAAAAELEAEVARLKRGTGRQQLYSVMAIGSGGFSGEGLTRGLQNRPYGVAVRHADFVFAMVGEEWGLMGGTLVVGLYAWLLAGILGVAWRTREPFGRMVCVGVAGLIGGQALMNLGIATGMLPVTGVPLPLVSYGGSSVVATLLALACVLDVSRRNDHVFFEA
jgi:rod shape determining protein RodA